MTLRKKTIAIVGAAVVAATCAGIAVAATSITVGDGWHEFGTSDNSQPYTQSPFTFTTAQTAVVTVTDVLCPGDRYEVSDGSTALGATSVPGVVSCEYAGYTSDPDVAAADPAYSHGRWAVGPGAHSIGVTLFSSPYPASGGSIRVDVLTKDMCKQAGWTTIQPFTSQGQCVSASVAPNKPR